MAKVYSVKTQISAFLDPRKFLDAVVEELKTSGEFSHRTLNRACGFASPNFIQLFIQGKRNLSADGAKKIARALGLSRDETRFFLKMVAIGVAESIERTELFEELLRDPLIAKRYQLSSEQFAFYSKWYNIVIREMLSVAPDLSPAQIGEMLVPRVAESAVIESMEVMRKLGFISKDGVVLHPQIATGNEVLFESLVYFHQAMIELGRESVKRFKGAERETSAITLRLTHEEFLILREKIRDFKKDALANESRDEDAQVYQFNFQLFPVTKNLKGPSK